MLRLLDGARASAKFIVFDACRNELQLPSKDSSKGLLPVAEQQGMFVAYASAPGRTASDRGEKGGPYATALAAEFTRPGLDHLNLFQNAKEAVLAATGGAQQPWESNGLGRRVYLTGPPKPVGPTVEQQIELAYWSSVKDSANSGIMLRTYLDRYPNGTFAPIARALIDKLDAQAKADLAARDEERKAAEAERLEKERRSREAALAEQRLHEEQARQAAQAKRVEEARKIEEAKRDAVPGQVKVAGVPEATLLGAPAAMQRDVSTLTNALQAELKRVGCHTGAVDGKWGSAAKEALKEFARLTKLSSLGEEPTELALQAVSGKQERVCPLKCPIGESAVGGRCVAAKPSELPKAKSEVVRRTPEGPVLGTKKSGTKLCEANPSANLPGTARIPCDSPYAKR